MIGCLRVTNPHKCFESLPHKDGALASYNLSLAGHETLDADMTAWPARYFLRTCAHFHRFDEHCGRVLARLRNQYSQEIAVTFDEPPAEADLFGLGFKRLAPVPLNFFGYDIAHYNHTRDWNNPKYWANPERWGTDFW